MNKNLTEREEAIYNFICEFWGQNHYSPSIRDISKACFISVSVAYKYLNILYDKGYISYVPNIARSITIKETGVTFK